VYPAPLVLNGVRLPWREKAVHLGHTLHQDLGMDVNCHEIPSAIRHIVDPAEEEDSQHVGPNLLWKTFGTQIVPQSIYKPTLLVPDRLQVDGLRERFFCGSWQHDHDVE